jgi:hypothetical protein
MSVAIINAFSKEANFMLGSPLPPHEEERI